MDQKTRSLHSLRNQQKDDDLSRERDLISQGTAFNVSEFIKNSEKMEKTTTSKEARIKKKD